MNKIYLAAITGAPLMAVAGIANARGTGTTSGSTGTGANQCWEKRISRAAMSDPKRGMFSSSRKGNARARGESR